MAITSIDSPGGVFIVTKVANIWQRKRSLNPIKCPRKIIKKRGQQYVCTQPTVHDSRLNGDSQPVNEKTHATAALLQSSRRYCSKRIRRSDMIHTLWVLVHAKYQKGPTSCDSVLLNLLSMR